MTGTVGATWWLQLHISARIKSSLLSTAAERKRRQIRRSWYCVFLREIVLGYCSGALKVSHFCLVGTNKHQLGERRRPPPPFFRGSVPRGFFAVPTVPLVSCPIVRAMAAMIRLPGSQRRYSLHLWRYHVLESSLFSSALQTMVFCLVPIQLFALCACRVKCPVPCVCSL